TMDISQKAMTNPEEIGAASVDYLFYSGYVVLAYWWARSVAAARASGRSEAFITAKTQTARFFYQRILPRTLTHAAAIRSGSETLMELDEAGF
ncbi:MAG: acyl-CoA dehydrogenase C-terminal domain-containing protein, partial [Lysobacteraceae bacterium]